MNLIRPKQGVSVVVPFFNEEASLEELCRRLVAVLEKISGDFEILFINDGSTDDGPRRLGELIRGRDKLQLLSSRRRLGKSAALEAGFRAAAFDTIATLDADLQDLPEELPRLIEALGTSGADAVSGWKQDRQDPLLRRVASTLFNLLTSFFIPIRLHDMNCGMKVYTAEAAKSLRLYGELHRFIPVILDRNGYRITEIPVKHAARIHGRSKYGWRRYFEALFDLCTILFLGSYRSRPLHFFGSAAIIVGVPGGLLFLGFFLYWLRFHSIGGRVPLLIVAITLILASIQLFSIGLIAELLARQSRNEEESDYR